MTQELVLVIEMATIHLRGLVNGVLDLDSDASSRLGLFDDL